VRLFFAVDTPALPAWDPSAPVTEGSETAAPAHLTVRFLGEVDPAQLPPIEAAAARAVIGVAEFDLELDEIGAFPSRRAPRIVWLGAAVGREQLHDLARRLSSELATVGILPEGREFVPHVTWRRIRSRQDARIARQWLERTALASPLRGRVKVLELKQSELSNAGARHTTLRSFPLGGAVEANQAGSRPTRS